MKIIDTHCHLVSEILEKDLAEILIRANQAGVKKIINVAYNLSSCALLFKQLEQSNMIYGAVGIQPHDVSEYSETVALQISEFAKMPRIVAIGEIGLDAHTKETTINLKEQIICFEHFLNIACDMNLPVIVHVRDTHPHVYALINQYTKKGLRGVIHCFTGTKEEAFQFLDCGFYISFAGIVTFKNAQNLASVAKEIPSDRILIETDSPYLAPVPLRGKVNEPSFLPNTCDFLAKIRNISANEFAQQTYDNSHALFDLSKS